MQNCPILPILLTDRFGSYILCDLKLEEIILAISMSPMLHLRRFKSHLS